MNSLSDLRRRWQRLLEQHQYVRLTDSECKCKSCGGVGGFVVNRNSLSMKQLCLDCAGYGADIAVVESTISERVSTFKPFIVACKDKNRDALVGVFVNHEELIRAIDGVEELDGAMPDKIWESLSTNREEMENTLRAVVRQTKRECGDAIRGLMNTRMESVIVSKNPRELTVGDE